MTYGAVIVAAGLSSRMGEFKPLLQIGSQTVAQHVVTTFQQAGIDKIVVVTGHNAVALTEHLSPLGVTFLHNPDYKTTQMFDSAKIGFSFMKDQCNSIFFTPVDVPLFQADTVTRLMQTQANLVSPMCNGRQGHPMIISSSLIEQILTDSGEGGLKGAVARLGIPMKYVTVDDTGTLHDADTPEEFQTLLSLYRSHIPLNEEIRLLLDRYGTPEPVRAHCATVAEMAACLARKTNLSIDTPLLRAACLLHDIARTVGKNHAHVGAEIIRKAGYPAVAEIIAQHHDLAPAPSVEAKLLFLADKLVQGTQTVSIQERFAASRAKCTTSDALSLWEMRYQDTIKLVNQLNLGFLLEQNGESI